MPVTIAGCQVQEKIYESENSFVYRGRWKRDDRPVILKMLKQPYPSPEKIAWFKREYELTRSLRVEGVINVYDLTADQHRPVMVLEDFGGESLELHLKKRRTRFPLTECLPLVIQVTDILSRVHQQHIMHKDVNPSNIVWNPQTDQVKLIDFGISTALIRESPVLRNPTLGEGTLAYISPEQTGRMNRLLDYRTDLYSLGVTIYELLTGQLPFTTADALALMHAHLARQPAPPHELTPEIPQPLSAVVMKLMAKNAEDRYQSAHGVRTDLEECLRRWETTRRIEPFPLSQQDRVDHFHIPQKLYGREAEIDALLAAFERVSQGTSEMMLVSGYAGVGKSALVREVYKPITQRRGYFITGKFDQLQRNIPYASLIQAFRSLMRQILTESEEQIIVWREKLLAGLGPNSQVLIDLIPELTLVIGPQPPVPILPPVEAQNRLSLVFQNFIRVFAEADHPLVIFLDDLQWADAASLNLERILMTALNNHYLFIIGAYRDNEVHDTHPVMLTLDEIQKAGGIVNNIVLQPLNLSNVNQLIADTLNCTPDKAESFAELVLAKTGGNPFFINEFLKSLYTEALLTFDFHNGTWQWEVVKIQERDITDNVIELMSDKLQKLGQQAQQVVRLAACIGNQFDLRTLAIVYQHSARETATGLWEALEEGIVFPLNNTYKLMAIEVPGLAEEMTAEYRFAHDRIQQAAYALIPELKRQIVHRQIGQLLLRNTPLDERERKIFDIVNQLNLGVRCITRQEERDELAELNLLAGTKAKAAVAHEAARAYLQVGLGLLGEDAWKRRYKLALALYEEAVEAAYLSGDYVQMEQLTRVVRRHAQTLLDQVKVYECGIEAGYVEQSRIREGIRTGLEVLGLLGVQLPENPSLADIRQGLEATQLTLAGKNIEDLVNLPEMTDPHKLATIRILLRLFSPAFLGSPALFALINCNVVSLSVKYGNTPLSARAYAAYGLVLCGGVGDIETGYRFGKLALRLVERFNAKDIESSTVLMANVFVRHWKEHIKETLHPLMDAYKIGVETGAVEWAALSAFSYAFQAYWVGKELTGLEQEMAKYSKVICELKQGTILNLNELFRQAVLNLLGKAENPCLLNGTSYSEETMLPLLLKANNLNALCMVYLQKLVLCYLFCDYSQAVAHAAATEKYLQGTQGTSAVPAFHYYESLACLAVFPNIDESRQKGLLDKVAANQGKMKNWAKHAPMNYLHKFYLVEAEHARVLGNDGEAREYYDKAIILAQENEYLNEEALGYELAGRFYLARGQSHLARYYLHDAHYAYLRWGAVAKVRDLETRYPQIFIAQTPPRPHQTSLSSSAVITEQHMHTALDARSVLKASEAITSEIVLDRLLNTLMKIVIESAGAQRGFLILDKEGQLVIEAQGSIDREEVQVLQSIPVEPGGDLPISILRYVERTQEQVVLSYAIQEALFATDPYITTKQPKSVLCAPLVKQGKLTGILYLENNLVAGAFTPERLEVLNLLSTEAAISIENAQLYRSLEEANAQLADYSKTLEQRVVQRTQALQEKNWELEVASQQVQEASRRKSQFLAGMSHQLRTPMNAILGFTRLVLRRAGDVLPERQRDNLGKVKESAEHLLTLINDLLDLSKIEAGRMDIHPGIFDLRRFIQACCETISPLVKPTVQLRYEISDGVGEAYTDEDGLRQIVLNLLSNAIRFTEFGEVVVRVSLEKPSTSEARLVIAVADTGVGIAAEELGRIFDEFEQLAGSNHQQKGTGLGLPIAKRWAELLGGSIVVESKLREGSTFTITIPAVYSGQQSSSPESVSI
jgi:predicted ATPase/signal transduction histidine kinase